ncbi:tetraacyldisaccharide 4'-kinase [Eionea flava]
MATPQTSRTASLSTFFLTMWYRKRWYAWCLLPLSWLYTIVAALHAHWYIKRRRPLAVPVVVVGNITTGGTGKTPVLIALAKALTQKNVQVGIVSRGYGSQAPYYPYTVSLDDTPKVCGDEPLLIARETHCPVVIGRDRVAAAEQLMANYRVDILLSDDGLQHHRLSRQIEIVVVDGERGLGNHLCLPAGPLREPARRLSRVDWVLVNRTNARTEQLARADTTGAGTANDNRRVPVNVSLQATAWRHVLTDTLYPLMPLPWLEGKLQHAQHQPSIRAIAGIGHPERFFNTLAQLDISCETLAFDDHHSYSAEDFIGWQDDVVLMTEKDAVKYHALSQQHALPASGWSLVVDIDLPQALIDQAYQQAKA